ncbi:MAG: DegT/DnrJ/EryC1/StrS family aminotransferase [Kiloniellales bacterium]
MNDVKAKPVAETVVPPARIDFTAEDRQWIADRIQEVLAGGRLTLGPFGEQFEQRFADYVSARHAVAVSSGTSALEIIFRALGIEGRDVLVPANTNYATVAPVLRAGGRPVLMDSDPDSLGTSPEELERCLTPGTAGAVVVHIGGLLSRRMAELRDVADRRGLWLVEDAAHAHGSFHNGKAAGTFGIAGAFSFYPTKVMTSGEGGMIVTDDDKVAEEARIYRDQGKAGFTQNFHVRHGYNWRLSEPHAVIGLRHLERLPEMLESRRRAAAVYDDAFADSDLVEPLRVPKGGVCNYYKYIVMPRRPIDRLAVKQKLREVYGVILGGEVYEEPIQRQPVFRELVTRPLPLSEDICARHLCLPMFSGLTEAQVAQVINAVNEVLRSA